MQERVEFRDGFTWRSALGAGFVALFMIPGGLYLGLVAGMGVGEAAEWVTIVLFAELARRSFRPLSRQEIYVLYYVASSLTSVTAVDRGLAGGPFSALIWNAFFAQSQPARPFAGQIPEWAVPHAGSPALLGRELWHPAWLVPIALLVLLELCTRLTWIGLGYALFRTTSDVERLPFPYAQVAASGAAALSESGTESWRWRVFSTGSVIGLLFGAIYVGLPVLSGIWGTPITVFPIPFADFTPMVQNLLPGAVVGLSLSLGNMLFGMVLPFEIVAGAAAGSVLANIVLNPILVRAGWIPSFRLGSNALATKLSCDMDFWLSVGIGVNLAVALLGLAAVAARLKRKRSERVALPEGRGDFPIWAALSMWFAATCVMIGVCHWLVPAFPLWVLVFMGLVWTPVNSYVSARMLGLTARGVSFPYMKEAAIAGSGYPRADIWYSPMPAFDHGWAAQRFREVELTGTKFTSIFKAELLMFPLLLLVSFAFWGFFWKGNPLPSGQFPYASKMWPYYANTQAAIMQMNAPGEAGSWFKNALQPAKIALGAAGGLSLYGLMAVLKIPSLYFYGFAGGLGAFPAITVPQFLGAWVGKRFLSRRFGEENWRKYTPILFAGFACGSGLASLIAVSAALIAKAVAKLPY